MKRSITALLVLLLLTPLFATASVFGETGANNTTTTQTTSADDKETTTDKTQLEARIKKLKDALKLRLTAAEKTRLLGKCVSAQGKVSSVGAKFKGIETSRTQVHQNILDRLNKAVTKLEEKGVASPELEIEITTLTTKMDTFKTDLATYKQSVADLKDLDCKTDPEGFKAALQTARTNLEKVRSDAKDIHTYLKETIRPHLTNLKKQLGSTENSDSTLRATDGDGAQ